MSDPLERLDYYTLLGLDAGATLVDVKKAFRTFARRYHPDRFAGAESAKLARATQIYRRGSEAFQVLTDPVSRRAYDRGLKAGTVRLTGDDRERAEIEERKAAAPQKSEPTIRSPQARAFYQKAADSARAGDWREAWRSMKRAIEIEPDNRLLSARLEQIAIKLRKSP